MTSQVTSASICVALVIGLLWFSRELDPLTISGHLLSLVMLTEKSEWAWAEGPLNSMVMVRGLVNGRWQKWPLWNPTLSLRTRPRLVRPTLLLCSTR